MKNVAAIRRQKSEPELLMSVPMPQAMFWKELENVGMSFHDKLFELIGKSGMDNKDVWKGRIWIESIFKDTV